MRTKNTRRELLRNAGLAAFASRFAWAAHQHAAPQDKSIEASDLAPFVDPLPLPQRLLPTGRSSSLEHDAHNVPLYRVAMQPVSARMHRDLPLTRMWSYGRNAAPTLIEAHSGAGTLIDWQNRLPARHVIPMHGFMDMPGMDMASAPETRTSVHLHGAHVPAVSDGYPEDWFARNHQRTHFYPNRQDAAALWFHDHAMGVNRFNIYAGLMGMYLIRDDAEKALSLPSGKYELPLMIYDRMFTATGQLFYPSFEDTGDIEDEFYGDAMCVNGKVQPFHAVEARQYRLRLFNTANARHFPLRFSNGQSFHIIGTDQGLLAAPVQVESFTLAPGERADVILNFAQARGEKIQLVGDDFDLMQFRVSAAHVQDDAPLPASLRPVVRIAESAAIRTREMTLSSDGDMIMLLNHKHWSDPVTETVRQGTTEIWNLLNLTDDTHPIHLHAVRFQVLDRRNMNVPHYFAKNEVAYTGPVTAPLAHEMGWKDVVQCAPRAVTRIIVPFHNTPGKYVWHCHVLEHEANDMMRPYVVVA